MAVASIRVSSVQLTDFVWRDFGFYSGAAAAKSRGREGVAAIGLGRNEGERRLIRGLRCYLTKAGGEEGLFLLQFYEVNKCCFVC